MEHSLNDMKYSLDDVLLALSVSSKRYYKNPSFLLPQDDIYGESDPEFAMKSLLEHRHGSMSFGGGFIKTGIVYTLDTECPDKDMEFSDVYMVSFALRDLLLNARVSVNELLIMDRYKIPEPRKEEGMFINITARRDGDSYKVVIEDTGEGIDPEKMPYIGNVGYTTGRNGFGIAYIRGNLQEHFDGSLVLESNGLRNETAQQLSYEGLNRKITAFSVARAFNKNALREKSMSFRRELSTSDVNEGTRVTMRFKPLHPELHLNGGGDVGY